MDTTIGLIDAYPIKSENLRGTIGLAYEPDKNYERDYERTCGQNYFVIHYNEIVQRISTEIDISECYDGAENHEIKKAVWDTGATTSVISESLARKFGLRSIGHGNIVTSIGQREVPIFELDIHLTRNITLKRVKVFGSPMNNRDVEFLIGMDIISKGNLSIDNSNGKTKVTFEIN